MSKFLLLVLSFCLLLQVTAMKESKKPRLEDVSMGLRKLKGKKMGKRSIPNFSSPQTMPTVPMMPVIEIMPGQVSDIMPQQTPGVMPQDDRRTGKRNGGGEKGKKGKKDKKGKKHNAANTTQMVPMPSAATTTAMPINRDDVNTVARNGKRGNKHGKGKRA